MPEDRETGLQCALVGKDGGGSGRNRSGYGAKPFLFNTSPISRLFSGSGAKSLVFNIDMNFFGGKLKQIGPSPEPLVPHWSTLILVATSSSPPPIRERLKPSTAP